MRESGLDPPGADVRGAPVGQVRDLDDVARARRVHDLAAADVDADVVERVEEDEVAGLQLVAGDRDAFPYCAAAKWGSEMPSWL